VLLDFGDEFECETFSFTFKFIPLLSDARNLHRFRALNDTRGEKQSGIL
jgi:hypothetical protein